MLGSLIFAILLAPAFGSLLMRRNRKKNSDNGSAESLVVRILLEPYRPLVTFFVRFRGLALVLAILLLAIGVLLFPMLGSEFTPELKEGTIVVRLTMAPSLSLSEGARTTTIVERKLMKIPDLEGKQVQDRQFEWDTLTGAVDFIKKEINSKQVKIIGAEDSKHEKAGVAEPGKPGIYIE